MTEHPPEPGSASAVEKTITPLDKAKFGAGLLESFLVEYANLLKLYFGLQTGALVILVKVLTDVHARFAVRAALAISILFFGAAAITCLSLLAGVAEVRAKMLVAWADEQGAGEAFKRRMNEWQTKTLKTGKKMDWFFRLAIILAGLFVVGVLVTN